MIQEGARLFEQLIVAIGINPDKKYQFTVADRLAMLRESCREFPNVTIAEYSNLYLIDYAESVGPPTSCAAFGRRVTMNSNGRCAISTVIWTRKSAPCS